LLHNITTALRKHYGIKERPEDIERLQERFKKYCDPFYDWERARRDRRASRNQPTPPPSPCSVAQERQRQADDDLTQALKHEPPLSPYRLGDPCFFPSSPYDRGDAMDLEGQETTQVNANMSALDINRTQEAVTDSAPYEGLSHERWVSSVGHDIKVVLLSNDDERKRVIGLIPSVSLFGHVTTITAQIPLE
jgi:hypothetical protein